MRRALIFSQLSILSERDWNGDGPGLEPTTAKILMRRTPVIPFLAADRAYSKYLASAVAIAVMRCKRAEELEFTERHEAVPDITGACNGYP